MAKRSDREPAKLRRTQGRFLASQPASELSTGFANDHQGPQRIQASDLQPQAGYKTAMNPPSQSFNSPLATWEASI
jgi:hypothetical protein